MSSLHVDSKHRQPHTAAKVKGKSAEAPEVPIVKVEYDFFSKTDALKEFDIYKNTGKKDKIPWFNKEKNCLNKLSDLISYNSSFATTSKDREPPILYKPLFRHGDNSEKENKDCNRDCEKERTVLPNVIVSARRAPWSKEKKSNIGTLYKTRHRQLMEKVHLKSSPFEQCQLPFISREIQNSNNRKKLNIAITKEQQENILDLQEHANGDEETVTGSLQCERKCVLTTIPRKHLSDCTDECKDVNKDLKDSFEQNQNSIANTIINVKKVNKNSLTKSNKRNRDRSIKSKKARLHKVETTSTSQPKKHVLSSIAPIKQNTIEINRNALIEAIKYSKLLLSTDNAQDEANQEFEDITQIEKERSSKILQIPESSLENYTQYKEVGFTDKEVNDNTHLIHSKDNPQTHRICNKGRRRKISTKIAALIDQIKISNIRFKTVSETNTTNVNPQKNDKPLSCTVQQMESMLPMRRRGKKNLNDQDLLQNQYRNATALIKSESQSDLSYMQNVEPSEDGDEDTRTCCGVLITIVLLSMVMSSVAWLALGE